MYRVTIRRPVREAGDRGAISTASHVAAPTGRDIAALDRRAQLAHRFGSIGVRPAMTQLSVIQRVLSVEEFQQVQDLALKIIRQYPPDRYHYLGLGKSPTPVMAFLQTYAEREPLITATNMPLSKFGHRTSSMTSAESRIASATALNEEQRGRLWEHFDAFVPGPDDLEGKDILLIDLVQSGKSLVATQRHLEEYLKQKYYGKGLTGAWFGVLSALKCFPSAPAVVSLPLAIEEQQVGGTKKTMDSMDLTSKAIMIPGTLEDDGSLAARMGGEKYKPIAEYPDDFKISEPTKPKTEDIQRDPRGEYAALKREFARFLAEDAPIVRLIEGELSVVTVEEKEHETERLLLSH